MPLRYRWTRLPLTPLVAASAIVAAAVGGVSGADPRLGIIAALGVIFVALVLTNVQIGFVAMVLFAFLEVLSVLGGVSIAKVVGALIVVAWVASLSIRGRHERTFFADHPGLTYLVLALVAWNAISVAWSPSRSLALTSVERYALDAFLLPIAYTAIRNRREVERVLLAIVLGASIAATSAILVPPPPESVVFDRATGTVGDPNELAAALLVGLALAGAFLVNRHIRSPIRIVCGIAAFLCLAGIFVSLSRGGLIGLAVGMVLAIVLGGRWRGRVLTLCLALAALAVGYFAFVAGLPAEQRVLNVSSQGGSGRLSLWTVGLRMVAAHPVQGVGSGQFEVASVHYLLRPGELEGQFILENPKVAHNTYLNVVANLGFIGGALFLALVIFCIRCAWLALKRVRDAGDERMEILLRGLLVGIGAYLATLMFLSEEVEKLLWILMALGPVLLAVTTSMTRDRLRPEGVQMDSA